MRKPRTPKPNPRTVIRCGNEDDAKLAYMAMFRYAFGRMTYMPSTVVGIIKANADTLTISTLELLDRDLADEAERYERVYNGQSSSNYGMECDRELWLAFHAWVKNQIENKKENTNTSVASRRRRYWTKRPRKSAKKGARDERD